MFTITGTLTDLAAQTDHLPTCGALSPPLAHTGTRIITTEGAY